MSVRAVENLRERFFQLEIYHFVQCCRQQKVNVSNNTTYTHRHHTHTTGFFFEHFCGNSNNWGCRKIEFCVKSSEFLKKIARVLENFEFLISDLLNKVAGKLSFLGKILSFAEKIG